MQITVTGRHIGVSERLERYCRQKSERLGRFFDRIQSVEVVLDGSGSQHFAEIVVRSGGAQPFVAREQHEDPFAAVDLLLDKVERQIRRHKKKLRNRKHPPKAGEVAGGD